jgi:hypothetical protein
VTQSDLFQRSISSDSSCPIYRIANLRTIAAERDAALQSN